MTSPSRFSKSFLRSFVKFFVKHLFVVNLRINSLIWILNWLFRSNPAKNLGKLLAVEVWLLMVVLKVNYTVYAIIWHPLLIFSHNTFQKWLLLNLSSKMWQSFTLLQMVFFSMLIRNQLFSAVWPFLTFEDEK